MFKRVDRKAIRQKKHKRIRKNLLGTAERPRLSVYRSIKHIYAQIVDDVAGKTLVSASTQEGAIQGKFEYSGNLDAAKLVGAAIAEKAKAAGIESVVFDRGGNIYHGRVKALADAAREAGLNF